MSETSTIGFYWKVIKDSFSKFSEDDIFTHSAALSYYTIFSLAPMLLIILYSASFFYDRASVHEMLFSQMRELVGREGTQQIIVTIEKLQSFDPSIWATIIGIGIMIFTATTVLVTMQNALNVIFNVKVKPEGGWAILKLVKDRVLSFALLVVFGFILLVSLLLNAMIAAIGSRLEELMGGVSAVLTIFTSYVLPFIIITLLFATIFKLLPDAKLKWRDTWFGAIVTSILFNLGKYGISFYIGNSNVAGLYDAAGSVMVIMVWVFYASLIFMYGAVFTYSRMKALGERVNAVDYAVKVVNIEIEKPSVPDEDPEV